ncbi:hypothetical protein ATC00_04700 [Sinorhizobium americanum]|nr:hypothetical protein ATC00_04700 [Sinorhizobium americanum]
MPAPFRLPAGRRIAEKPHQHRGRSRTLTFRFAASANIAEAKERLGDVASEAKGGRRQETEKERRRPAMTP